MKKLSAIILLTAFMACNDSGKTETTTESKDSSGTSTNDTRSNEVADSTRMLDKMLADSTSTMTPDSLK